MHFTILSKKATLLKFPFFSQVPGQIEKFTYMPLDGRKAPRKIKTLAMRPLALGRRRLRPIPGESAVLPSREECREVCGLTLGRFVPRVGRRGNRRRCTSMPSGGGRGGLGSGERGARPGQGASLLGPGDDGETPRGFTRHWRGAGWKARRRWPWWLCGAGRSGGGRGARARGRAAA
jgi:hypothetical protein